MGTATITINDLRPYLKDIIIFANSGVFDFKNGYVIIHKDKDGKTRKIVQRILRYNS